MNVLMHCNWCFKHRLVGWMHRTHLGDRHTIHLHTQRHRTHRNSLLLPCSTSSHWSQHTCRIQSYFHNRWQEASENRNRASGLFIYYWVSPVSINHLHRSASWLRYHSSRQPTDTQANKAAKTRQISLSNNSGWEMMEQDGKLREGKHSKVLIRPQNMSICMSLTLLLKLKIKMVKRERFLQT